MDENTETPVYEIDLSKKYVLVFPYALSQEQLARIKDDINQWIKSDKPFMILTGGARLMRVEAIEEQKV
jgi:glycine/serine hydroxymethyltransferase